MPIHQSKGFTLVELAIVLVIIGLLIGGGIGIGNTQIQLARITATKQKQEAIKTAITSYIARNNRLPCPAIATLAPGTAGYGTEAATSGTCTGTVISGAVTTGIVPWSTLGLSDENGSDGYYNRFTYQVALAATNTTAQTIAGLAGAISIHTATPATMGSPGTGNQSNVCNPTGWTYNPCLAVAVIVSHGSNGSGAYSSGGTQVALPAGADELENANNDSKFVVKDYSNVAANPFDDIVLALTPQDLLSPLTNSGAIADYAASLNKDMKDIKGAIIAYAVSHRTGASSPYSYTLPPYTPPSSATFIPTVSLVDPWGNRINYVPTTSPITIATKSVDSNNSLIVAFTLISLGPNGADDSGQLDDIKFTVYVSELQAIFMGYGG